MRTSEKRAAIRLRIASTSGPWKILATNAPPGASSRSARASASSTSAAERAWSVARIPVVLGAMSERTTSNAFSSPKSSPSATVSRSAQRTRAPAIGCGSGIAIDPHHRAVRADDLQRVLHPRARPAAEVEHPVAGAQEPQLAVDLLQLVDRARGEPRATRLREEGVVTVAGIAELRQECASPGRRAPRYFFLAAGRGRRALLGGLHRVLRLDLFDLAGDDVLLDVLDAPLDEDDAVGRARGLAPLMSTTSLSSSTFTTTRSEAVLLTFPMSPDIRLPLWTRPGVRRQPIRAAVPEELVRSVGRRVTGHAVLLHDALVALALGGADHVDDVARLEHLGGANDLADLVLLELLGLEPHLAQVAQRLLDGGLLEEAALGAASPARRVFSSKPS